MKVAMLGGMPNPDYPNKGIFNRRAAEGIGEYVDLTVISVRMWKPGRKFKEVEQFEKYKVLHLAIPNKPSLSVFIHLLNQKLWMWFILLFAGKELRKANLIHSVSGGYGYAGSMLASRLGSFHVLQLTGSDVNSEFPRLSGSLQIKTLLKNTHRIVGNSKRLVEDFGKLFDSVIPGYQIYRGANLEVFDFHNVRDSVNRFLYIGGLDAYPFYRYGMNTKGGLTLMKAWQIAEEKLNDASAQLWFGGPSTPNEQFGEWRASLKYPDNVINIGSLNPESVREAYDWTRFVLLPSMEEGLPNVAVEASAKGKVVIGSDVGGIPEVVLNDKSGFVFKAGDEMRLSDYLLKACQLKVDDRQIMSNNARKQIEKDFDASHYGEKYYRLYQELCVE